MSSWIKFLDKVETEVATLKENGCDIPFFRGHSNSSWKLIPSLYRESKYENLEAHVYYDFLSYSAPLLDHNLNSTWDILFEMRHSGLPTRLLDWSENFSVALYFAIKDNPVSPCIWILDPFALNLKSNGSEVIYNPMIDFDFTYVGAFIEKNETSYDNTIAIFPLKQSKRVFAQKGVFTLHCNNKSPINEFCDKCVTKIDIPSDALNDARKFLYLAGVNEYSMFPDLDGLSRYLIEKHLK